MKLRYTSNLSPGEFRQRVAHLAFYHEIPFGNGLTIPGWFKVADTLEGIGFPDVSGKAVLDIGPASGYFSFAFEQMGASVTALEISDPVQFNRYGINPLLAEPQGRPPFNRSTFLAMKDLLRSNVEYIEGSIYDLGTRIRFPKPFDVVFIGSLLIHLRDPVGALCHASAVCHGEVIATTVVWEEGSNTPLMKMARPSPGSIDWWLPNPICLNHWLQAAGLRNVQIGKRYLIEAGAPRPGSAGPATSPVAHRVARGSAPLENPAGTETRA